MDYSGIWRSEDRSGLKGAVQVCLRITRYSGLRLHLPRGRSIFSPSRSRVTSSSAMGVLFTCSTVALALAVEGRLPGQIGVASMLAVMPALFGVVQDAAYGPICPRPRSSGSSSRH